MNEETETKKGKWCGCCCGSWRWFFIPPFIIAAIFIVGAAVMYLWNAIIPHVFTMVGAITYWQALGILVLSKILFGGFRKGGCGGKRGYGRQWKEKWMGMSEEEKAKFKEEWKNRGGSCGC